jgi:hypothetical protein
MEERKGFLTPEQEKTLEGLIKFNNKLAESVDGLAIQLIDNQGLERLKNKLAAVHPEAVQIAYEIIDALFDAFEKIEKE